VHEGTRWFELSSSGREVSASTGALCSLELIDLCSVYDGGRGSPSVTLRRFTSVVIVETLYCFTVQSSQVHVRMFAFGKSDRERKGAPRPGRV
jgi:hypothetical protein